MKIVAIRQIRQKILITYIVAAIMGVVSYYFYATPISSLGLNDADARGMTSAAKIQLIHRFYQAQFFSAHSMTLNTISLLLFAILTTNVAIGSLMTEARIQNYSWMIHTRSGTKEKIILGIYQFVDAFLTFILVNFGMMIGILLKGGTWGIYNYPIKSMDTGYPFASYMGNIVLISFISSIGFAILSLFISKIFSVFAKSISWFRVAGPVIIMLYILVITIIVGEFVKQNSTDYIQHLVQILSPTSLMSPGYDGGNLSQFPITAVIYVFLIFILTVIGKRYEK